MASLEIISFRDPKLLHSHLQILRQSNHAVPTAADLLAAFFDRAAKFQSSRTVFIDMAIQTLTSLNITLEPSVAVESRSAIINRLTELILEGATSDWLSISNNAGPIMTQVYRYVLRCSTSDSKSTRVLFERFLTSALRSLALAVELNHESSACISMELGEYYLMNADLEQASVYLKQAMSLFTQCHQFEMIPDVDISSTSHKNQEISYMDPESRISISRLEALLQAIDYDESAPNFDENPDQIAFHLLDPSTPCWNDANALFSSIWNFLHRLTPVDIDSVFKNGINVKSLIQFIQNAIDAIDVKNSSVITCPPYSSERLRMLIEEAVFVENQSLTQESLGRHYLSSAVDLQNSCFYSRSDIAELLQFCFRQESISFFPFSKASESGFDVVINCARQIEQKHPAKLLRLLFDSEHSDVAECFIRSSISTSFSVAALLTQIANNLPQAPLSIDIDFFGGLFADIDAKRLLSNVKVPCKVLRPKLLKSLLGALLSSLAASSSFIPHFKAIAKVLYASLDYQNCARVLLTIVRLNIQDSLLSSSVLTDPVYYEMLITSLSETGETFDAAVLCQYDNFIDLEKGSRLLLTSPRRSQPEMFTYILYPELIEALFYAYDRISPDNTKKQAALNAMSRPILLIKRNNPQRNRILEQFLFGIVSRPKYCFHSQTAIAIAAI